MLAYLPISKRQLIQAGVISISTILFSACTDNLDMMDGGTTNDVYADATVSEEAQAYEEEQIQKYIEYGENPYYEADRDSISSFSLDADGASYANAKQMILSGQTPPSEAIRVEEFVNFFPYNYELPTESRLSVNSEVAQCPWDTTHHLVKLGLQGADVPASMNGPANYVLLIDVSGSMSGGKLDILKTGFKSMVENLDGDDWISIVTYAGVSGVALEPTQAKEYEKIATALDNLGAGGSTNGSGGIIKAYELAERNFNHQGINRVILGSDGDFNVGVTSTEELTDLISEKRNTGIYLTTLGVGGSNYNDANMEQLANKGNGTYEFVGSAEDIYKIFIDEKDKFYSVATDVKVQVVFNSTNVKKYRLIGYENRIISDEEFEQDSTDAAEIGANQTITAIYEVKLNDEVAADSKLGTFEVRYKEEFEGEVLSKTSKIKLNEGSIEEASEDMRFAASVVGFGLLLKGSNYKGEASKEMIQSLAESATSYDPGGYRATFLDVLDSWDAN